MDTKIHNEITAKFSIVVDKIETTQIPVLEEVPNLVDLYGKPIIGYQKRRWGEVKHSITLNGITIDSLALKSKLEYLLGERNAYFAVETYENNMCALVFSRLFYRLDYMLNYRNDLKTVFRDLFNVELDITEEFNTK